MAMPRARPRLEQRLRHRRAADDRAAQARQVGGGEARLLREEEVRRGNAHHRRHALLLDQPQRALRVELALEDDGRALPPGEQRLHVPPADVELRQHLEHDVVLRDSRRQVEAEVRPEAVRVRQQRALRLAGRAGGVDEQQAVVVRDGHVRGLTPGRGCFEPLEAAGRSCVRAPRTRRRRGRATAPRRRAGTAAPPATAATRAAAASARSSRRRRTRRRARACCR